MYIIPKKYLMHSGKCVLIDESMFNYFLEVLPPIFMNRTVNDVPGDFRDTDPGLLWLC
jgi:hypothetical protein